MNLKGVDDLNDKLHAMKAKVRCPECGQQIQIMSYTVDRKIPDPNDNTKLLVNKHSIDIYYKSHHTKGKGMFAVCAGSFKDVPKAEGDALLALLEIAK